MGYILGLFRFVWGKLSIKTVVMLLALAIVGWYGYKGYSAWHDRVYAQGVASQASTIQSLKDQLNEAQDKTKKAQATLADYKASYNQWVADTEKAQQSLKTQQKAVVDKLTSTISTLNHRLTQAKKDLNHEVARYVDAQADAHCTVPNGFVLLYNQTIHQDTAADGSYLTRPSGTLADAPSGVPLSTVARIISANNLDAVKYRNALIGWQTWYNANAALIHDYMKDQAHRAPGE